MSKYKAIIFDCDGTVLDTATDLASSVNFILAKYHYPTRSLPEVLSFLGHGLEALLQQSLPAAATCTKELVEEFKNYYFAHCLVATKPYAGILEMLHVLQERDYKLALVSNKNKIALAQLNALFFASYMGSVIGESSALPKKPAPDMVRQALAELGVSPNEALYVGDSEVDKQTADNAGLDCMLVTWGFRTQEQLQCLNAKYLVMRVEEISEILV